MVAVEGFLNVHFPIQSILPTCAWVFQVFDSFQVRGVIILSTAI